MSLEQTLGQTNTLLSQLITILTTGLEAQATIGEPEKKTRTRKASEQPAVVTPTPTQALGLVEGDPEGTRYFVIEKHNSVYAQKPGEADCTIAGCEIVTAEHYLMKKAEFAAKTQAILAAQKSPAATQAAASPTAPTASPSQPVAFQQIVDRITVLNKSPEAGHGREGVLVILRKYLPGDERPSVTKLQALNRNAEILADIEAALAPAAEAEFDPLA